MIFNQIFIFGGTHGNERTGISLIQDSSFLNKLKSSSLPICCVLANEQATTLNRRYVEEDLNRVFQDLNKTPRSTYEFKRGLEIKTMIQKHHKSFVIDLHTTTSHMGMTVIFTRHDPTLHSLLGYLFKKDPNIKIIYAPDPNGKYLISCGSHGLIIEIGAISQGVKDYLIYQQTQSLIDHILNYFKLSTHNTSSFFEYYEEVQNIYYPTDFDKNWFIHPDLLKQDFKPLSGSINAFINSQFEVSKLTLDHTLYPIFINEAAYVETSLAFSLCVKKTFPD